ncbi:MAG TPA: hypothetical protein VNJ51_11040 [Candidatus Dormibacteraeota bacterium]|nr:hypothetical protein [Candidatus Dormibacteraeota bacterium]
MRVHLTVAAAVAFAAVSLMPALAAPPPEKIGIEGLNNSGEAGVVTLTAKGNKTLVSLQVEGEPKGAKEPSHIHRGPCDHLNPVPAYPLNPLVNGRSTTVVNAPLSKLMSGNYSVNVHQSVKNLKHYVACGQLVE